MKSIYPPSLAAARPPARLLAGVALIAASLIVPACSKDPSARETRGQAKADAQAVELREWNGERLDPVSRFEENSIKGPQRVEISKYRLRVGGLVAKPAEYTYDEVLAMPAEKRIVTLHCVEGWDVKALWEGVPLKDLLGRAEVKPEAETVIFKCYDGYSTSVPLKDLAARDMLLAFKINGLTLPAERGYPFTLLAVDKWGYKSARWVTAIELSNDPNYRGYWEKRGYNVNGDVSGPMFDRR